MSRPRTQLGPLIVTAVVLGALLGGCSDDQSDAPALPEPTQARWNPCDGLDPVTVGAAFGAELSVDEGTASSPVCTLTPDVEGDPVLDANYLLFPEGLDAAWASMGDFADNDVLLPRIPGTDDARLVVDKDDKSLFVTGFVQNGDLIQTVNVIDPAPYDRAQLIRGVRVVMAELSAHAVESGLTSHG